jgi:trans-aconitate methyltransferase
MKTDPINTSAQFYGSTIGKVNEQSIVNTCAMLNIEMVEKHSRFDSAIFMGLGEGSLLERIGPRFEKIVVVEASDLLIAQAQKRFAGLRGMHLVNSYFEKYEPVRKHKVSCILGNHVLEHLNDPVEVLRKSLGWLSADGISIFTVPNATSLHRRIGVEMGVLQKNNELSQQDKLVGHQRVYDRPGLRADVIAGGYAVIEEGGFNLKLVSQAQMVDWPEALHAAIYRVSRECPAELCSNLYVVCRPQ